MPAEPGALNQTHKDTNLHLLSVWRGFPKMKQKGRGFPKTETKRLEASWVWIEILFWSVNEL